MKRNDAVAYFSMQPHLIVIILLTCIAAVLRFVALERSPSGFYVDEAAIAAQVICVRQSGHDDSNRSTPLFSPVLGGGYATPVMLYGGSAWTAIFGDSIASFRSFSALHGALTILGVFLLALILWGRSDIAWFSALCVALSPWSFLFSRIAWDPALAPCYFIWGLVIILYEGRFEKMRAAVGGLLLSLACYSYPPLRMQAALVLPLIAVFAMKTYSQRRRSFLIAGAAFLIGLIPLLRLTLSGEIQGRFNVLSIANEDYLRPFGGFSVPLVLRLFVENLALNLSPKYLFLSGDANLRHSTQAVGQWSWLEILALVFLTVLAWKRRLTATRRELVILFLLAWAYLAGVTPAALTWESNPHALRSIGATPFLALTAGFILAKASDTWRFAKVVTTLVALGFAMTYFADFFWKYPERSAAWFDASVAQAPQSAPADYPELALRYYKLRDRQLRCENRMVF